MDINSGLLILVALGITVGLWSAAIALGRVDWRLTARGLRNGAYVAVILYAITIAIITFVFNGRAVFADTLDLGGSFRLGFVVGTVVAVGYLWLGGVLIAIGLIFKSKQQWTTLGAWAAVPVIVVAAGFGYTSYRSVSSKDRTPLLRTDRFTRAHQWTGRTADRRRRRHVHDGLDGNDDDWNRHDRRSTHHYERRPPRQWRDHNQSRHTAGPAGLVHRGFRHHRSGCHDGRPARAPQPVGCSSPHRPGPEHSTGRVTASPKLPARPCKQHSRPVARPCRQSGAQRSAGERSACRRATR